MKYSNAVLDRIREPRCAGTLSSTDGNVGTGEAGALPSGTLIRVQVRVETDRVVEARFKAFGCSAAIASASFVAEHLGGLTVGDAQALVPRTVIDALELPAERAHVAGLAVDAARAAIASSAEAKGHPSAAAAPGTPPVSALRTEGQGFSPGQGADDD